MKKINIKAVGMLSFILTFGLMFCAQATGLAETLAPLDYSTQQALDELYAKTPGAKELAATAKGILVFPAIVKGGFIVGGQYGEGTLIKGGKAAGRYNSAAASYGLQAGIQKFGYALFFMTDADMAYLDSSAGWEIGVGPSVVVVDEGIAKSFTTTTVKDGIYAFFFSQKGLMAGLGLQGTKITKIAE